LGVDDVDENEDGVPPNNGAPVAPPNPAGAGVDEGLANPPLPIPAGAGAGVEVPKVKAGAGVELPKSVPPGAGAGVVPPSRPPPKAGAGVFPLNALPPGAGAGVLPPKILAPGVGAGVLAPNIPLPGPGAGVLPNKLPPGDGALLKKTLVVDPDEVPNNPLLVFPPNGPPEDGPGAVLPVGRFLIIIIFSWLSKCC